MYVITLKTIQTDARLRAGLQSIGWSGQQMIKLAMRSSAELRKIYLTADSIDFSRVDGTGTIAPNASGGVNISEVYFSRHDLKNIRKVIFWHLNKNLEVAPGPDSVVSPKLANDVVAYDSDTVSSQYIKAGTTHAELIELLFTKRKLNPSTTKMIDVKTMKHLGFKIVTTIVIE